MDESIRIPAHPAA